MPAFATPSTPANLAAAVRQRAEVLGVSLKEAAEAMGLTYTHLLALCSGERRFAGLRREKMSGVARFVGLPLVHCYLLAGSLAPEDFVVPGELARRLQLSLAKMRADPEWGGFAPAETAWQAWPEEARLLVALLYERRAGELTQIVAGATA